MNIEKIIGKIDNGVSAYLCTNRERKLVRQVDTGIRKLDRMSPRTAGAYLQSVKDSGHYSKNPLKRLISFVKSWNANRKRLIEDN